MIGRWVLFCTFVSSYLRTFRTFRTFRAFRAFRTVPYIGSLGVEVSRHRPRLDGTCQSGGPPLT